MQVMKLNKLFFALICSVVMMSMQKNSFAQIGGSRVYSFMELPYSAKSTALGSYHSIVWDNDLSNAFQNPSLLNPKMNNVWSLNVNNYVSDIQYGYIATAFDVNKKGMISLGVNYIDYGNLVMRDEIGNEQDSFKANENAFNVTYSNAYKQFRYGVNLKTIFSNLATYRSTAVAVDLGGSYVDSSSGLGLSFSVLNIGSQVSTYYGNTENLPFEALFTVTKKLKYAPFRFSLTLHDLQKFDLTYKDPNDQSNQIDINTGKPIVQSFTIADKLMRHVAVGTELLLSENFNLRVGYNHQRRRELYLENKPATVGFSWGFGIRVKKINISYGSAKYHVSGNSNMFSISLNPTDFYRKKKINS